MDDLRKRIAAARCYAGLTQPGLADAIGLTAPALERLELGLTELSPPEERAVISAVAEVTGVPVGLFTADLAAIRGVEPPEDKLARLESKVDEALRRMDAVVLEAEGQMSRGKAQLDRFIANMQGDRDTLGLIAETLGVPSRTSPRFPARTTSDDLEPQEPR